MGINANKNDYLTRISKRIYNVMTTQSISQAQLLSLAEQRGYCLKQSTLSKILSDASSMSITNIIPIANILGIDLNDLFSENDSLDVRVTKKSESVPSQSKLIRRADTSEMRPYLHSYNTYFFPTLSSDENILSGKIRFSASDDNSKCIANFSLQAGSYKKEYEGDLILSANMRAAYCTLINEEYGEISYILFSYIPILFEDLECRVALVLTSSAGSNRMPTAHRMIMSKTVIPPNKLDLLKGQLYLNESEILISEAGLKRFWNDPRLDPLFREYFQISGKEPEFPGLSSVPYCLFDESVIRSAFLDSNIKINAINLIRQYSTSPKYNKIGSKCDEIVFRFIKNNISSTLNNDAQTTTIL